MSAKLTARNILLHGFLITLAAGSIVGACYLIKYDLDLKVSSDQAMDQFNSVYFRFSNSTNLTCQGLFRNLTNTSFTGVSKDDCESFKGKPSDILPATCQNFISTMCNYSDNGTVIVIPIAIVLALVALICQFKQCTKSLSENEISINESNPADYQTFTR